MEFAHYNCFIISIITSIIIIIIIVVVVVVVINNPILKLKKTSGARAFSLLPLIYGTICPFTPVLRTILTVLNLYLKRIFLDL